jgi:cellulose synthase/poly-beta-1,6-N-acetylglucosamine synthase-like glycosyltransferase
VVVEATRERRQRLRHPGRLRVGSHDLLRIHVRGRRWADAPLILSEERTSDARPRADGDLSRGSTAWARQALPLALLAAVTVAIAAVTISLRPARFVDVLAACVSLLMGAFATMTLVWMRRARRFPAWLAEGAPMVTKRKDEFHPDHVDGVADGHGAKPPPTASSTAFPYGAETVDVRAVLASYFPFRSRLQLHARACRPGSLDAHPIVFDARESITPDECPARLGALIGQQTRWNQGLVQALFAEDWRQSPFRHRVAGVYILVTPYVMALGWMTMPVAILAAAAAQVPITIALCLLLPVVAVLAMLGVEVAGLIEFRRGHRQEQSACGYGRLVLRLPLYETLLAVAVTRAMVREARASMELDHRRRARALLLRCGLLVFIGLLVAIVDASLLARLLGTEIVRTLDAVGGQSLASVAVSLTMVAVALSAVAAVRLSWRPPAWPTPARRAAQDAVSEHSPAQRRAPIWLPSPARTEAILARWYAELQPRLVDGPRTLSPGIAHQPDRNGEPANRGGGCELGVGRSGRSWRAALIIAISASVCWIAWTKQGPWEYVLIIGGAMALAIRKHPGLARPLALSAGRALAMRGMYFARTRSGIARAERTWRELPDAARALLPLLALLNLLLGLKLRSATLFLLMAAIDLAALTRATRPSVREQQDGVIASPPRPADRQLPESHPEFADGNTVAPAMRERGVIARGTPRPDTNSGVTERLQSVAAKIQPAAAVASLVAAIAWIAYAHPGPALIPAVLAIGLTIPSIANIERDRAITMVLCVAVVVATVDYVSWRFGVTNWQGWWIAAPLVSAEAFGALHVLGFQLTIWPRPQPSLEQTEDPTQHPVFIFVPTLNEGVDILRPTLQGCVAARDRYLERYPDGQVTIVVCNDGRAAGAPSWKDVDALAEELGVSCVSRMKPGGAKAGNIESARQAVNATGHALMAIFDADQVPQPDFLLKTVPPFADPTLGWVQTGQYYANLRNPVSRWADDQQSMFYNLLCPGKAAMNAAFICGTNVVLRTAALDEIGGLPQDSVTEDFAASIRLHTRWRSIYLTDVVATGLGPLDVPSYFRQQARWALGTLGVFRSNWRDILLPRRNGLRLGQRAQYLLACTHYLCGLRDLVYLTAPLLFIATGVPAVHSASLTQYLLHFLPYAVLGLFAMWYAGRGVTGPRGIIIGFGCFPVLLGSLFAVLLKRKTGFVATAKKHQGQVSFRHLRVHLILVLLCVVGLVWATEVRGEQVTSLFISVMWLLYSLVLLGSFLWLALQDAGLASVIARWGAQDEVAAKLAYPAKLRAPVDRVTPARNLALAALLATPLLVGTHLSSLPVFSAKSVTPFVISHEPPGPPYLGVSVAARLLWTRPGVLERDLGARFSIVGRTQDVQDRFDVSWAAALRARGARPWITLEFGVFGPGRRRPLTASLPAIINGIDDADIARWATEIRDFGHPVYLTILRHVDKNWSLTSAVTGGGIPEDVPKAWDHVRSIFQAVGARNVAWVWAPADPTDDQAYAPPPSAIDVVLQSFINYPGTRWGDPRSVLRRLAHRYPEKPVFVEASVAGIPSAKAAWLAKLRQALDSCAQLYAFLDHEGGPELQPTTQEARAWSLASDPVSLAATKDIVVSLRTGRRAR